MFIEKIAIKFLTEIEINAVAIALLAMPSTVMAQQEGATVAAQ